MTKEQLAALRKRHDLTQRQLADLLGTSESTIVRLEAGRMPIDTRWASHLELVFTKLNRERTSYV